MGGQGTVYVCVHKWGAGPQWPQRHERESGLRGIMDFLAEEPSSGAGTGCPGLKRETGVWLSQ